MVKFDYDLLTTLASVVREGSFDAASLELNITQSAVSQRVKLLEARMGAILIVRGRPCTATGIGSQLCRHIDQVRLLEHDLLTVMQDGQADEHRGPVTIRIAVNADSLATWFAQVITRAGNDLNILFDIIPDDQEHTAGRLSSGEALAAITAEVQPLHGFRRIPLGTLDYIAVCNPDFVITHFAAGITPEAIAKAPCLIFDRKDLIPRNWFNRVFGTQPPLSTHWIPSFPGYLQCCCNGAGWGLMPRLTAAPYLLDGSLVELRPAEPLPVPLYWQCSANAGETMRVLSTIVIKVAREHLSFVKKG
jgi:LysR family transcriptional regulator (chromosome initiation inhibitor)